MSISNTFQCCRCGLKMDGGTFISGAGPYCPHCLPPGPAFGDVVFSHNQLLRENTALRKEVDELRCQLGWSGKYVEWNTKQGEPNA
jgi:hypothetical protein